MSVVEEPAVVEGGVPLTSACSAASSCDSWEVFPEQPEPLPEPVPDPLAVEAVCRADVSELSHPLPAVWPEPVLPEPELPEPVPPDPVPDAPEPPDPEPLPEPDDLLPMLCIICDIIIIIIIDDIMDDESMPEEAAGAGASD